MMKAPCAGLIFLAIVSRTSGTNTSPVSRVVELLQGLAEKVEEEGKTEETLYNKFVCWANSNIDAKTASNAAANTRLDALRQYISDIDAGLIEFTTERVDLEKEIAELTKDLEAAAALRAKEQADFESAQTEMNQGIAALQDAIRILEEATNGTKASMLAVKGKATLGFAARAAEAASLSRAADLGDRFLSKGNARFLRRVLTGDVPQYDYKRLNKKADFKMTYEARSGDIQTTLAKLLNSFQNNLAEATSKETAAQDLYNTLSTAKGQQKTKAEQALLRMDKENGARGMNRAEAQAEVDALETQVADDTTYISQVRAAKATKKSEWEVRSKLRSDELTAISEAINVLHSDDARDMFKKSLASQGYFFLQLDSTSEQLRTRAIDEIQAIAKKTHDRRLQDLAKAASGAHFDAVINAIDSMLQVLQTEEATELAEKEACENQTMVDTRAAVVSSRHIDDLTDEVDRLNGEIAELNTTIEESNKEIARINEELAEADRIRADQAADYSAARAEDVAAVALVQRAHSILATFYSSNNLMLMANKQKHGQAPISAAGEAPPPPPTTWEEPYGGKTGESTGIMAILNMIAEDMQKDIDKADAAEQSAIQEHNDMVAEQNQAITDLNTLISQLQGTIATKEGEITTAEGEKALEKQALQAVLTKIADERPACDYRTLNYPVRTQNRQIEIDGLLKAKAILQGADFGASALVQKKPGLRGARIRRA